MGESYALSGDRAFELSLLQRTASVEARFLLDQLRPGMKVLDCGSGPGSITIGIAKAMAPGMVTGVDIQATSVAEAQALADRQGVANVRFEVAKIHDLPFPEGTFDAVYSHATVQHLPDQVDAITEMRRVLRPGGLLAIADADHASYVRYPDEPRLGELRDLVLRTYQHHGGNPLYTRGLANMFRNAGLHEVRLAARANLLDTQELEKSRAHYEGGLRAMRKTALAQGWTDETTLDALVAAQEDWMSRPDAYLILVTLECTGQK